MMAEALNFAIGITLSVGNKPGISNIGQLFEALASGYGEVGYIRCFVAGDRGQFVRISPPGHPFYRPTVDDIPVITDGYGLKGFIRFEMDSLYPGMFTSEVADDGAYCIARLTDEGARFARLGASDVMGIHRDIDRCSFFNPKTLSADADLMIDVTGRLSEKKDEA